MKSNHGGPALVFERPLMEDGATSPMPVAINLFGSMRRICLALGVERLDDIGCRITQLLDLKMPEGLLGKLAMLPRPDDMGCRSPQLLALRMREGLVGRLAMLPRLAEMAKFPPKPRSGRPPCQEI